MKFKVLLSLSLMFFFTECFGLDVQGHRGARSVLPENSMPAFEYALKIGVDTIELDTGVTADGVVIIYHDQKINKTLCQLSNGGRVTNTLWIHQLTFAEVQKFDCGSRLNPRFKEQQLIPGTKIPSLRQLFELVLNSDHPNADTIRFNIETKSNPRQKNAQPAPENFAKAIIELIEEFNLTNRTTIQSFDHRTLLAAKEIAPDIPTAALYSKNLSDWITPTLAVRADIVSPHFKNITHKEVIDIQKAGLTVIPWTANQPNDWATLIDMGVDGIITDNPLALLVMLGRASPSSASGH